MSRKCAFTNKGSFVGNRVSHANNKTRVRLFPNLQEKRVWIPSQKKFVRIKLSTSALRTLDKIGPDAFFARYVK